MPSEGIEAAWTSMGTRADVITVEHAQRVEENLQGLTHLLNLEYLQAEFYARALDGNGLGEIERGVDAGSVIGGRAVSFTNPLVAAFVKSCAKEERDHILILREMIVELGAEPVSSPKIDLDRSFTMVMRAAMIVEQDVSFDAFANDTNLMFAAYVFEDVVGTAYQGVLTATAEAQHLSRLTAIATAEAGHSALVRAMLLIVGLTHQTNAISVLRQRLCGLMNTCFQGSDHGVGTLHQPTLLAVDGRSIGWSRTSAQCLQILYGNAEGTPGWFFPDGIRELSAPLDQRYTLTYLGSLASSPSHDPVARELRTFPSERVEVPSIRWDVSKLPLFETRGDIGANVTLDHYNSTSPRVLELDEAMIFGAVGIVAARDVVVQETLWHTDWSRHHYRQIGDTFAFRPPSLERLPGTTVSILTGAAESYWHSIVDAALRLILIDDELWGRTTRLLVPSTGLRQQEFVELFEIPASVEVRSVLPRECFLAETLILPSSLHGMFDFHASLTNAFFDRLLTRAGPAPRTAARRIFVDRRGSNLRSLVCEDQLIAALPGFQPVRLEALSLREQARLFAEADIIVAPHGAGLSNIGFARPGTIVIELMMDTYRNWCFRRLAAARGLTYFCVLGRSLDPGKATESVHLQTWIVEIADVQNAVAQAEDLLVSRQGTRA